MGSHLITLLEEVATAGTSKPQRTGRSRWANEPGSGNSLFEGGAQVVLEVERIAAVVGTLTVYGMDLGDPNGAPSQLNSGIPTAQLFRGDGATVAFQTVIPFVTLANNNWIVTSGKFQTSSTATVAAGSNLVTGAATAFLTEYFPGQTILINGEAKEVLSVTSNTVLNTVQNFAVTIAGAAIFSVGSPLPAAGITSITNVGGFALVTLAVAPALNIIINVYFGTPVVVYAGVDRVKKLQTRSYDTMWTLLGATPTAASVWLRPASGR